MLVHSFASEQRYVLLQFRVVDGGLHVQGGADEPVNRDYGVAADLPWEAIPPELHAWIKDLEYNSLCSFAGSGAKYRPMQARVREDGLHFQIGGPAANREYGAAFTIPCEVAPDLVSFVKNDTCAGEWEGVEPDSGEDEES